MYLTLNYSAMATKNLTYGAYISRDAFVLELPDGTSIAPESAPSEILDEQGVTVKDLWVSFMIPSPATGKYTLEARDIGVSDRTPRAKAALPLELPSFPTFGDE